MMNRFGLAGFRFLVEFLAEFRFGRFLVDRLSLFLIGMMFQIGRRFRHCMCFLVDRFQIGRLFQCFLSLIIG